MKKVYFVRHGESEGNAGLIYQGATSPLTEKGREQGMFIATRCEKFPIEFVVSITMTRAKETSALILQKINKPIEYSDLFAERRRPKEQRGLARDNPKALEAEQVIRKNLSVPGFRLSDEENFEDLKERAGKALAYLLERPEENILVVTHGYFMRVVLAYAVFGEELNARECGQFIRKFHTENTGVTILGCNEKNLDSPWWLWVWNDHAHLG